jgi:hypothetical protein
VFFREEWKHQFDGGGPPEGPVGPEHVSNPELELKYYGEAPKGDPEERQEHTHAGMWMNKRFANDPAHLFTGTCNRPCALTLRHRAQYVDLSGFGSKIRWYVKFAGFHQIRPVLKLADGTILVGDHADGWVDAFDWYTSEILIASVRWRRLDPNALVTTLGAGASAAGWVEKPDVSRVDEVGFVDLMPGAPRQRRIFRRGVDRSQEEPFLGEILESHTEEKRWNNDAHQTNSNGDGVDGCSELEPPGCAGEAGLLGEVGHGSSRAAGGSGERGGGRGGFQPGFGAEFTVRQDAAAVTITRAGQATPLLYKLDGSESKNMVTRDGQQQEQVAKARRVCYGAASRRS